MGTNKGGQIGTGTTITFGTSAFTAEIMAVTPPPSTREKIKTSYMSTTLDHTYIPASLVDHGELEFDISFEGGLNVPLHSAAETITITYPDGDTWVFSGFVTDFTGSVPLEDKMTGTIKVAVSGAITVGGIYYYSSSSSSSASSFSF